MNYNTLRRLAREGEGARIEFKRSTAELKTALETLCGYLNERGGTVIVGAKNDGTITGMQIGEETRHRLAAELRKFEPVPSIQYDMVQVPNRNLYALAFFANPSAELRPYTFDGRPYERVDNTTRVMSQQRYQQLLLERVQAQIRWETGTQNIEIWDLEEEQILATFRRGVESGRIPEAIGRNPSDILDRLNLLIEGKPTNAALVLFGKEVLPRYPQCLLRLGRFRGFDKSEFIDNRQVYGNVFRLVEESLLFLRRHLPVSGRVQPGLFEREDELLFPLHALREALVNAFCHRDYSLAGGSVSLAIYDDRLEVWSDGTLPIGMTIASLKQDHQSRPRNPLIASVLYKRGLVESWGRGTQKIVELCVDAGHPEPEFFEQAGAVGVRFIPREYIAPNRVALDLTSRQREILQVLSGRAPGLPLREIAAALSNRYRKALLRSDLDQLRRLDLVGTEGHARGAVWFLQRT
ncbi:MAG: putative DNA binding domain-containing protein [Alphaproteobacteria bacterium]|nr:putative DNA binding domain-containing protein [Alphaproteobacteria bacterium]MBV9861044.1 putative DNA binding domain-containing protein [Alphaproteobacteria bacterium]